MGTPRSREATARELARVQAAVAKQDLARLPVFDVRRVPGALLEDDLSDQPVELVQWLRDAQPALQLDAAALADVPPSLDHPDVNGSKAIMSPGGFPAGVNPGNILRQVVPRNRLLADVLGRVGYVEQAGYGVDMMYEQMLRLGKEPPWFIPDELGVRVVIRNTTFDEPFASFVQRRLRASAPPTLEQLLLLDHLKHHLEVDVAEAAALLQRTERETSEVLAGRGSPRRGLLVNRKQRQVASRSLMHMHDLTISHLPDGPVPQLSDAPGGALWYHEGRKRVPEMAHVRTNGSEEDD